MPLPLTPSGSLDLANVFSKWYSLATHLGLTASELDVIEQEIPAEVDTIQQRLRMLEKWVKGKTGDPSWMDIVSVALVTQKWCPVYNCSLSATILSHSQEVGGYCNAHYLQMTACATDLIL